MNDELPSPSAPELNEGETTEQTDAPRSSSVRKRKRRRYAWRRHAPILTVVGLLVVGWVLYGLVWPTLEIRNRIATAKWKFYPGDPDISVSLRIMLRTCEYLYCFWFFYLGASIGSFINVVASRVPRGLTIVSRGSHCPYCDQRLRMLDNIPVFGWIALRGRCRTCHLPIAPRYLVMELIVGSIFMSLAIIELIGNGMNLPYREWKFGSGIVYTVFYPKWNLIGAYVTHASLLAVAVMLIASHMDRLRFPKLPLVLIGMIYVACATFEPLVAPVRWTEPWGAIYPRNVGVPWDRFQTSMMGLAAGTLIGLGFGALQWVACLRTMQGSSAWFRHSLVIFMLAGTLLGWQVVFNLGIGASAIILLVLNLTPLRRMAGLSTYPDLRPQVLALVILTITLFLHHLLWRQLAFLPFLPFRPES